MGLATRLSRALFRGDQLEGNIRAPADWLFQAFGGATADTGERVGRDRALTVSGFWRAMNLLSFDVAKVPLLVMKNVGDSGKERAKRHVAYKLLRREFNPYLSAYHGKAIVTYHRMMHGNGYCIIDRDPNTAVPRQLILADPTRTWPVKMNGRLWYIVEVPIEIDADGNVTKFDLVKLEASDVLHIRGLGFDGLVGYDVLTYARESLAMSLAPRKYGARFFANGAVPSMVLEAPGELPKSTRDHLLSNWNKLRQGLDKAHKTALLTHGIKANVITPTARDSQLVELRKFEIREIANFCGVPPHMLGDDAKSSYNSIEMENQRYLDTSLDHHLCAWEDECTSKLLTEAQKQKESHCVEALRESIVSIDFKTRIDGIIAQVNNGLLSDNEARRLMNRPSRGPEGDRFRIPSNIMYAGEEEDEEVEPEVPAGDPPQPDEPPAGDEDESDRRLAGARACLEEATRRMVTRLGVRVGKAAKDPSRYVRACEDLVQERQSIAKVLQPAIVAMRGLAGTAAEAEALRAADALIAAATEIFLEAGDVAAAELHQSVRAATEELTKSEPARIRELVETGA